MWKFTVNKVEFRATQRPVRTTIGCLDPVLVSPKFSFELNRPGDASVTVEHFEMEPAIRQAIQNLLEMNSDARMLELVVLNHENEVFWAGPFVGMNRRTEYATELLFKDDLYWLQRLIIHDDIPATRVEIRQLVASILQQGLDGYTDDDDATQNLNTYLDFGVGVTSFNNMVWHIQPSEDGENAINPRQTKTVLEWIQFLAERSPEYSFNFGASRTSQTGVVNFWFDADGENRSQDFHFLDNEVVDTIAVASSFAVKDLCNVVYAVGEGSGQTQLGNDGRVWYYSSPALLPGTDPRRQDTRPLLGTVFVPVSSPGLLEGGLDAANEPDGSQTTTEEITSSVEAYADAVAFSRVNPLIVPTGYKKAFEVNSDSPIINTPYYLMPGDYLELFQETGFAVGDAPKAVLSKLEYEIKGDLTILGMEFK